MIGVVVVTHGQLATELVNAAETIVGDLPQFAAVSIGWHDDVDDAREELRQAMARVAGDAGVLLLTDMFGGTPSNLGLTFLEPDKVEVDFAGTAMNMGFNRPQLKRLASGRYEGQTTLPVCVSGAMEWQATVIVTAGDKVIAVPFRFDSGHA